MSPRAGHSIPGQGASLKSSGVVDLFVSAAVRKAAIRRRGLTVHNEDNPVFPRLSADGACLLRALTGQRKSFPQNIPVTSD
jgi:hypothetical protein